MDKFSSGWAVLIIGALECICVGWVYGYKNFRKDIALMIGEKYTNSFLTYFWSSTWLVISPVLLIALAVFSLIQYKPLQTDNYIFPYWVRRFYFK